MRLPQLRQVVQRLVDAAQQFGLVAVEQLAVGGEVREQALRSEHVVTLPEVSAETLGPLFERVQSIARVLPAALGAQGTFVAMNNIVSQSVSHLHVHVVPRTKGDGLKGFFWPRSKYESDDLMRTTAEQIRSALAG